jgi:hypothetical protein
LVTYGAKYAVRKTTTPRMRLAHNNASRKPRPIVSGMLTSVKYVVFHNVVRNSGSRENSST